MSFEQHRAAGHAVLFAESDAELAEVVADPLAQALLGGEVAIVIATETHRRQFDDRIRATGLDLTELRRDGSLIALDAAETLARLMPGGSFDAAAFDHVIGALVRTATSRRPVLAFGEMVGLLWDDGLVQEAIELEEAWNGLLAETGASLMCAYSSMFLDAGNADDLNAVCGLHSAMLDGAPFERAWHFGADVTMATDARRLATTALRARGLSEVALDDIQVVVAELVANAVLHGGSPFSVTVRLDGERLRVEVADDSHAVPVTRTLDQEATGGRGLHLLTALTVRWGVDLAAGGKVVWAELAR